jgi:multimeric flavodoxin WrbA
MNEIYPLWVRAHGIMLINPVNWYSPTSPMKLMMDRLVCADGGNPDPTSTHGKDPERAKALELKGWPYPRHLAGRLFSVIVHGDASGAENLRRILTDWLSDMALIPAGSKALLDRYVGYYRDYATSHDDLDQDRDFQAEVRNAAATLVRAVALKRQGKSVEAGAGLKSPRPK